MVAVISERVMRVPNAGAALSLAERREFEGRTPYVVSIPRQGPLPPLIDADAPPQRFRYEEDNGRVRIYR